MRRPVICIAMILAVVLLGLGETDRLAAATISGGDYGGADLIPEDGDELSGTFTNVGTFHVMAGRTVFVAPGVALSITAVQHQIDGTLDGSGAGHLGGDQVNNRPLLPPCSIPNNTETGMPGAGAGGGGGGLFGCLIEGSGGGGGGYGGAGGQSGSDGDPAAASGGATVGDANTMSIEMGSGGGSGSLYDIASAGNSGAGGRGGAAITLLGPLVLTGSINVNATSGLDGFQQAAIGLSAGGGGSGGGVLLDSTSGGASFLNGLISAAGGAGGDGGVNDFGSGGGGGGGGRIKLFGTAAFGPNFVYDVSGGSGGISAPSRNIVATAGDDGTFSDQTTLVSDSDGDGVDDADDLCPDTDIPESVPTRRLGVNRFALIDGDGMFDTTAPKGQGPRGTFTTQDTAGCSCEQIIAQRGLGRGHTKFGCSIGTMRWWLRNLN